MAGGTFIAQNKIRPGAYINFKAVAKPLSTIGIRGVMTMPVAMEWGDTITELYSTDLVDGKSLNKIGYSALDTQSLIFREALKHTYKAIIYRTDTGGDKAQLIVSPLTVKARYAGAVGNDISIKIVDLTGGDFKVITFFRGTEQNIQIGKVVEDLEDNDWVTFSGTGALAADAGTNLSGGTNGSIDPGVYTTYMNALKSYKWDTMGIPVDGALLADAVVQYIKSLREDFGRKVQAVLYNADTDYEGIISISQGYKTKTETINAQTFVAYIAGLTAGSQVFTSNTYHVIPGAVGIVGTLYTDEQIEQALQSGKLVLSTRQDGVIVIEQDINTLHSFTADKGYAFSKNRVIRTLDEINNSIALLFERSYLGKVDNNDYGRNIFKADIVSYLNELQQINAIQNFDSTEDIEVLAGKTIDSVVVNLAVQPVDSMEKLYMTVMVG